MNKQKALKTKSVIVLMLSSIFFLYSCEGSSNQNTDKTETEQTIKAVYTCPMHPEVKSDKADQCPKCGMDLIVSADLGKNVTTDTIKK